MSKKSKVLKGIRNGVLIFLALAIVVVGVLFFPLMGKKHVEIWGAGQEFDMNKIQTVEMKNDELKILMFTDTQFWSDQAVNKKGYEEMDKLVEQVNPDMIVTVGDNLSALESRFGIKKFINKMDSYGVPWTVTFGNHDAEIPTTSLNWQADQYMKSDLCMFEKGPSNLYGCGNYVINITKDSKPIYSLFMFDNGRYTNYGPDENGKDQNKEIYMGYDQIAWYKWNVEGITKANGQIVPSMTFSHFAQPEFKETLKEVMPYPEFGEFTEYGNEQFFPIPKEYGQGELAYLPAVALVNSGFVDTCKELGSTKYMFCGHDHENYGSVTDKDGMTYTYGLKTGPSPVPWNNASKTGGTVITIDKDQQVTIDNIVITEKN